MRRIEEVSSLGFAIRNSDKQNLFKRNLASTAKKNNLLVCEQTKNFTTSKPVRRL